MSGPPVHSLVFRAEAEHIDVMGHVNNAVWVQWLQDAAGSAWAAMARPEDQAAFVWLVVRHEVDYRGNIGLGETAHADTWIEGPPRGATSVRRVDFRDAAGRPLVTARSTWALIDRASGRPARVRAELFAPFAAPPP